MGSSRKLTFSRQQGPHVIWLCVVGVIEDEVLHDDAVGLSRGTPVHLDSIGVEWVQPQVRWRSRGTWQRRVKTQREQQKRGGQCSSRRA